ncbi:MAG: YgaP-like transmembrane domain [Chromatocurvus sp.]
MIESNLGGTERVLRLIGAIILTAWVASRDSHDILTPLALLAATALTLNFLFSRCYLWALLGLNSCKNDEKGCPPPRQH